LLSGPRRPGELLRVLSSVAKNRLGQNLRQLERGGFVTRTVLQDGKGNVPHVEYGLTRLGRSLSPVIEAMREWAASHGTRLRRRRK
jgi:DNA-binding HxlR family transcriptional regulator